MHLTRNVWPLKITPDGTDDVALDQKRCQKPHMQQDHPSGTECHVTRLVRFDGLVEGKVTSFIKFVQQLFLLLESFVQPSSQFVASSRHLRNVTRIYITDVASTNVKFTYLMYWKLSVVNRHLAGFTPRRNDVQQTNWFSLRVTNGNVDDPLQWSFFRHFKTNLCYWLNMMVMNLCL